MEFRIMRRIFIHSKSGKKYELLEDHAKSSETLEELVVYKALYGNKQVWVRPRSMFFEDIIIEGKLVPRFKEIKL